MALTKLTRRKFIKGSISALAVTSIPQLVSGQSAGIRLEWNAFKQTTQYPSYLDAISQMRANPNANARESWQYWVNIHRTTCPHGVAYFCAWHRGYLLYLQQTLRVVSGNSALTIPYWDYYSNANIPPEFTDPSPDNPLYVPNRVNTNVRPSLSLTPFWPILVNFPRGMTDAFEPQIEYRPHGSFHNLVGGVMATLDSPMDPLFWLHHGQIDRLWAGWVAANAGRQMPPITDPYWSGTHVYRSDLTMRRDLTYSPANLRYAYDSVALPTSLPPSTSAQARIIRVQTQGASQEYAPARPPAGKFPVSGPRAIENNRRSIGGASGITLGENSVSAIIPISPPEVASLEALAEEQQSSPLRRGQNSARYTSLQIVLDDISLTPEGRLGGYYYSIYMNLPERGNPREDAHFIGSFGPFEINAAQHHPGSSRLVFHATRVLPRLTPNDLRNLSISFVRISGQRAPQGPVITVGEARAELSNDPIQ